MSMKLRGNISIPQSATDPYNPISGDRWVRVDGLIGSPGLAMGVMGLTYTEPVAEAYILSYRTAENRTIRVSLGQYGE